MNISFKKILIAFLIILLLSKIRFIAAAVHEIFISFYDAFEPLRDSPPLARYTAAVAFLALVWITVYYLLLNRRK